METSGHDYEHRDLKTGERHHSSKEVTEVKKCEQEAEQLLQQIEYMRRKAYALSLHTEALKHVAKFRHVMAQQLAFPKKKWPESAQTRPTEPEEIPNKP